MKTLKFYFFKMFVCLSFILVVLGNVNAQTENTKNTNTDSASNVKPIDIQSAIVSDNLEVVKQHIQAGSDVNMKDAMSGSTPLITAATFGRTAITKALIDAGADLNIKNSEGSTALHAAAFFCRVEIVKLLIDAGADKTLTNNYGATPRQSITGPFSEMKPIYDMIQQQLGPLGLELDLKEIEINRPLIATMLW